MFDSIVGDQNKNGRSPAPSVCGGGQVLPMMAYMWRLRPKGGAFFRLQVYERVEISLVVVYKRVGKSVIWVCERAQKN